jgi:CBS domain-containing protein
MCRPDSLAGWKYRDFQWLFEEMLVKDLMTVNVASCGLESNLAEIAETMWRRRCGALPVISDSHHVVGVITDRDVCIAVGTRDAKASQIFVRDVMAPRCFTCLADQNLREALSTMSEGEVDRLPVVDNAGQLIGILSIDDIVCRAGGGTSDLRDTEIISALRGLRETRVHNPSLLSPETYAVDAGSRMPLNYSLEPAR